jgi:hypothetical protein
LTHLKIAGNTLAGKVKIPVDRGELGLKDGQSIVGRVIGSAPNEVVLQLAGKTLAAQLEGKPLIPGTVALFGVKTTPSGTVELQVLTNLAASEPGASEGDVLGAVIMAACRCFGQEGSPAQVDRIAEELRVLAAKYGQAPPPEALLYLRAQNWPVTPGTLLLSWLCHDRELRDYLWTRLRYSASFKGQPGKLPPVWDLGNLLTGKTVGAPAAFSTIEPRFADDATDATDESTGVNHPILDCAEAEESRWEQMRPLLEKSLNLDREPPTRPGSALETVAPFLIRTAMGLVTELRLKWSTKSDNGAAGGEELVRLTVPTTNLGEIALTLLIRAERTQIIFKVGSAPAQEYLRRNLDDLKKLLGDKTQISVVRDEQLNLADTDTKVDLWM